MLLFFNTVHLCQSFSDRQDINLISDHRKVIGSNNSMFYDRSETIVSPIKIKNMFPIPKIEQNFNLSYQDICNITAKEIADKKKKIRIMWSGGIDSTLIVVSFLKLGLRDQLEIALSLESIAENYNFYKQHILGKIKIIASTNIEELFSEDAILVGGEFNDQLLGSNMLPLFSKYYDPKDLFSKFDRNKLVKIFSSKFDNSQAIHKWIEIYLKTTNSSPVPIESNLDFHWWINFCCKWQGIYYRLASYTDTNVNMENYQHFFQNELFQKWALLNHSQHFNEWRDYKKICKDIIFEYDRDRYYLENKIKTESLTFMAQKNSFYNYIDENQSRLMEISDSYLRDSLDFKLQ